MKSELKILSRTKYLWQAIKYVECLLYGVGMWFFLNWLTSSVLAVGVACFTAFIFLLLLRPWKIDLQRVAILIDRKFTKAENSTTLLLNNQQELSVLAQLQRNKLIREVETLGMVWPPNHLLRAITYLIILVAFGYGAKQLIPGGEKNINGNQHVSTVIDKPNAMDSLVQQFPEIDSMTVVVVPPAYTGLKAHKLGVLNIQAVEQSKLYWSLRANDQVASIYLEVSGKKKQKLMQKKGRFTVGMTLTENGFYNFKIVGQDGQERITDLYRLEAIEDKPPAIAISGIDQYTTFDYADNKQISFTSLLTDDFGLSEAYIIATVSKGSGESVKFREEQLAFDNALAKGTRSASLTKSINLDSMQMTPGDELYFYVEAIDTRVPVQQRSRTETYFLTIKDTTDIEFSLAGSLGVDLMPEYFRSQRQIIIDTEKLIKDKSKIAKHDFNAKSNELGFDQKTLRLKYGQFMGEEAESGIAIETEETQSTDDPLANYTHDHDNGNEHNLVDTEHKKEDEDPLHKFIHNHDDPEEATLYTVSIKGMLKQAMAEMWDAELYLRLYQPGKSLPYQYKALNLIKQIKNHARIYVHRIGFDPPPLKEDKRLSGDLEEVESKTQVERTREEDRFMAIKEAIENIDLLLLETHITLKEMDFLIFEDAGTALASLAVEEPVKYLKTLEWLKKLAGNEIEEEKNLRLVLQTVGAALAHAVPQDFNDPVATASNSDSLTWSYLKHLNTLLDE